MMDSPEILRRLEALEKRTEELGMEIGEIARIMLEAAKPAEDVTEERSWTSC